MKKTLLVFLLIFGFVGLTFIAGCSDDDDSDPVVDDTETYTLSDIFPMAVGNQWVYANVDSIADSTGTLVRMESTMTINITDTITYLGRSGYIFQSIGADSSEIYLSMSGDSLFESGPNENAWTYDPDIQGFTDRVVGDVLFSVTDSSTVDSVTTMSTDVLKIDTFTGSITTADSAFSNCLVLMEEKFDYTMINGAFSAGEHSIKTTYLVKGIGLIQEIDRDWELTSPTENGDLIEYEEGKLTSYTIVE